MALVVVPVAVLSAINIGMVIAFAVSALRASPVSREDMVALAMGALLIVSAPVPIWLALRRNEIGLWQRYPGWGRVEPAGLAGPRPKGAGLPMLLLSYVLAVAGCGMSGVLFWCRVVAIPHCEEVKSVGVETAGVILLAFLVWSWYAGRRSSG